MRIPKIIAAMILAALGYPLPAPAQIPPDLPAERGLSFLDTHTKEELSVVYFKQGAYDPAALAAVDRFFRDPLNGQIAPIDPRLLDLLFVLRSTLKSDAPYHLICGYRSPDTNGVLRRRSSGVSANSRHMSGTAADIRLPGVRLSALYRAARDLRGGGVGYYPSSDFIHVDIGPVRYW